MLASDGDERQIGSEASKSIGIRTRSGFMDKYLSGNNILDIGYLGYVEGVVPVVPQAIGIELDYPGYDGKRLPFEDASQDAVFSSHCLEHIADYITILRDWYRVLKPGGFMIIVVPHQFLYEKRQRLPSRWNEDHKRFYTPASLLAEIEAALSPNSYRVRHLVDNDFGFDYSIPPAAHSGGCYEIELVVEKINEPSWGLEDNQPVLPVSNDDNITLAKPDGSPRLRGVLKTVMVPLWQILPSPLKAIVPKKFRSAGASFLFPE